MRKLYLWLVTYIKRNRGTLVDDVAAEAGALAGVPLGGPIMRIGRSMFRNWSKLLPTREALYKAGAKLLREAEESVVVLSTLRAEAGAPLGPHASALPPEMREYFIELHRRAYRSRIVRPSTSFAVRRYVDLRDESKCEEAISLLYHGNGVEIHQAHLPIEFLLVDEKSIMLGFPNDRGELSNGFLHKGDKTIGHAMKTWVTSYAPDVPRPSYTSRQSIKTMESNPKHGPDCMCKLIGLFNEDVPDPSAPAFDRLSWYPHLYATSEMKLYNAFNDCLRRERVLPEHSERRASFLDCGCGAGFGAAVLSDTFQYWGIDRSPKMIAHARAQVGVSSCSFVVGDFFSELMGITKNVLPKKQKFTMIACQGNTFDHLLGCAQKALALYLFDLRLELGGLLMFTGAKYAPTELSVRRTLSDGYLVGEIEYKRINSGNYCRMNVPGENPRDPDDRVSLFTHRVGEAWLTSMMDTMGYELVDFSIKKFVAPGGKEPYDLLMFRKTRSS